MRASACSSLIMMLALSTCCTSIGGEPTCSKGACPSSFVQFKVSKSVNSLEEPDDDDGAGSGDNLNGQLVDSAPKGPPPDDHLGNDQKTEKIEKKTHLVLVQKTL